MTPNYQNPNYQQSQQAIPVTPVDRQKVDMYIMSNQKYFPAEKLMYLREKLYNTDESRFAMLSTIELKEPTTILIVSVLLGSLGVDRFMLKDVGLGVLKLLTGGCCGIMTIVDWFTVQKKAKEINFNSVMMML